jgi:hypothetical protein
MPLLVVSFLFWSMLCFGTLSMALDEGLRELLRSHWKMIAIILVITAVWRIPSDGVFFHGLEYEDSYVYTVAGRQLAGHWHTPPQSLDAPFSLSVCEVGSLATCQQWETFPEHLIGFPYVIGFASQGFGYKPSIGSIINLAASLASALLAFLLATEVAQDSTAGFLAGLVFAATPVFAIYGLETSAEPFSGCCMLLSLWFFVRLCDSEGEGYRLQIVCWCAYTCALLFTQTVKREDTLMPLLLPALIPFCVPRVSGRLQIRRSLVVLILLSSAMGMILATKMHLLHTCESERELLHRFPLTAARLASFVGSFLSSFLVTRWYGGSFLAVGAGLVIALQRRDRTIIPVSLLAAFIILYSSHIRGYYEMESGRVSPGSALRFSMNIMGLWAIVAGVGVSFFAKWIRRWEVVRSRTVLAVCLLSALSCVLLTASFIATSAQRSESVEDEILSRVRPASAAVRTVEANQGPRFILTMDPLIVQMYFQPDIRVIDLESVDTETLEALVRADSRLVLLKRMDRFTEADLTRYGEPLRYALSLPSQPLASGTGFEVSSIKSAEPK